MNSNAKSTSIGEVLADPLSSTNKNQFNLFHIHENRITKNPHTRKNVDIIEHS